MTLPQTPLVLPFEDMFSKQPLVFANKHDMFSKMMVLQDELFRYFFVWAGGVGWGGWGGGNDIRC